ncbi:MAG: hypothetical protein ACI85O_002032 [Saprospiraceae bacterium]|jgi:hypothetical protein
MYYRKQYNIISKVQNIRFDDDGFIVDSDEQIFDTTSLEGDSLARHFPLIDSILSILQQLTPGEPALYFAKVETVFYGLEGIYDYSFSKEIRNENLVTCWQVIDKTEDYRIQRDEQQARQNDIIL